MPPFMWIGDLFGNYVVVVEHGWAVLLAFAYLALTMSVPYLANLPQLTPRWIGQK
ncbi:hypothetical protein ACWD2L_06215 [Streptomyces sp. NPDC002754]